MEQLADYGFIAFVLIACCWYCSCMYFVLRSLRAVICYTLLPIAGIIATAVTFAAIGVQHTLPPLFLAAPLIGSGIGVYVAYRIDEKFS